jgi:integrase
MRQGEALALTSSDIREDRIRITKTWDKTVKKALPPKTKAGIGLYL